MIKTYRPPTVVALGAAEVLTRGIDGTLSEIGPTGHPVLTGTTHQMLDL
jgi:hypothetical protein